MGSSYQRFFAMRPHILVSITSLASASIVTDRSSLPEGAWMPKELGRFHIPHAGFIEVYDNEEGKKDLYITTFNPALPYFHDPVYMIPSPGEKLNSVTGWADEVITLGVKASAYWPNFPVKLPKEVVGFEGVVQTSGFLVPGKNTGKLELYNRNDNARGPIDIAAGQDKDWSYHWVIWKDVDDASVTLTTTASWKSMLAPTIRGRATRQETFGCTSSKTTPRGRGLPLPQVSSPTLTYLVAQWPQARVCFSGQVRGTRTPQLLLGHSPNRGSQYQGTTTVSTTSCSQSLRIQRTGNTISR